MANYIFIIVIIIILLILYCFRAPKENYINSPERAQYIVEWFNRTPRADSTYLAYREHMSDLVGMNKLRHDADVVEYQTAKILFNKGALTVDGFLMRR